MSKKDTSSLLCCFCFDRKSAIFVICSLAIFHSIVSITLATKVLLEDIPRHVYVIAIAVKTVDAPDHIKNVYLTLNQVKLALFIMHFMTSISLLTSLHFYKKYLHILTPVFVTTELSALIYTLAECVFTTIHLDDFMSRVMVAVTMVVTGVFILWCALIIAKYTRYFYAPHANILNRTNKKKMIAYYKSVEEISDMPKTFV